jgi:hypothetical protein
MITHESEFSKKPNRELDPKARELAACYARVFLAADDGKRVLADLRLKFGLDRPVFVRNESGQYDVASASLREGQRQVMMEIEEALKVGAPGRGLSEPKP